MSVSHLLEEVSKAGLTLRLTDQGKINVKPVNRLTPHLRELIHSHKVELVSAMQQKVPEVLADDELFDQLLEAAMRCCFYWSDGEQARALMVEDIHRTPKDHWLDLLEHFNASYGKSK
jgi:hypothetical protein